MTEKYLLFFDDTGSRNPNKGSYIPSNRDDRMDCFGLGGILIKEEDIADLLQKYNSFCSKWNIDYPLHSSRIRGGQGGFGWLKKPENAGLFLPDLQDFLLSLPFVGIACIIHRPGYAARYKQRYESDLWALSRTAFCILVERSAKFADEAGRKLEIYFEASGKREDRAIIQNLRSLKLEGHPFEVEISEDYQPLGAEDYRRIVLGEPRHQTKQSPLLQIADLILYPMAKGGYDPDYYPYKMLKEKGKLIDNLIPKDEIAIRGIKYSCFD